VAKQDCEVLSNICPKEIDDFKTNKRFIHKRQKEQKEINIKKKSFFCIILNFNETFECFIFFIT
jgi:hypothetical protein